MRRLPARHVLIGLIVVVVLAGAVVVSRVGSAHDSGLARAFTVLPHDTLSVGYTDWRRIDDAVDADSPDSFDSRARERDLTSRSVFAGMTEQLDRAFGWTTHDLDWEAYGQARAGDVLAVGLGSGLPADDVVSSLREAGYDKDDGVWRAQSDEFRRQHPELPDELSNVVVLDRHTLLAGAELDYLEKARDASRSLAANRHMRQAGDEVAGSASALVRTGWLGCDRTGFDDADESTQAEAQQAVSGQLRDYDAVARAVMTDGQSQSMQFAMTFESSATASRQLQVRKGLTRGPFIGRGEAVEDSLVLTNARTDDTAVTLTFDHDVSISTFMDATGPVLFATCSLR